MIFDNFLLFLECFHEKKKKVIYKKNISYEDVIISVLYPVDTGRILNIHKTFRRRPGRFLNVLCTFNLRPVSTGYITKKIM